MIKTAHLAEAFNMPLEIHHGASPIMNWANLHVACAIPNCDWFEVLVPEGAYDYGLVRYPNPAWTAWSWRRTSPAWVSRSTGTGSARTR